MSVTPYQATAPANTRDRIRADRAVRPPALPPRMAMRSPSTRPAAANDSAKATQSSTSPAPQAPRSRSAVGPPVTRCSPGSPPRPRRCPGWSGTGRSGRTRVRTPRSAPRGRTPPAGARALRVGVHVGIGRREVQPGNGVAGHDGLRGTDRGRPLRGRPRHRGRADRRRAGRSRRGPPRRRHGPRLGVVPCTTADTPSGLTTPARLTHGWSTSLIDHGPASGPSAGGCSTTRWSRPPVPMRATNDPSASSS